jgi:hypothetical protein
MQHVYQHGNAVYGPRRSRSMDNRRSASLVRHRRPQVDTGTIRIRTPSNRRRKTANARHRRGRMACRRMVRACNTRHQDRGGKYGTSDTRAHGRSADLPGTAEANPTRKPTPTTRKHDIPTKTEQETRENRADSPEDRKRSAGTRAYTTTKKGPTTGHDRTGNKSAH